MSIIRTNTGQWSLGKPIRGAHPSYTDTLLKCLNSIDQLYSLAKEKCEFEFIQVLLHIRGLQDEGWDPFETLREVVDTFNLLKKKLKQNSQIAHFVLFTYGLIFEASEPYERFANLLNILEDGRFNIDNFPVQQLGNGRTRPQHPLDKINQIKSRARSHRIDLSFFDEFTDNQLRNAIFHSDYTVFWPNIRTLRPTVEYSYKEWLPLINKALGYYEALVKIHALHVSSYKEPKTIAVHPQFSGVPNEKGITIIREKHGIIGIRHNFSPEEIQKGAIPWRLCRSMPYEKKLIDKGVLILPANRAKRANKLIRILPRLVKGPIIGLINKYYIGRN